MTELVFVANTTSAVTESTYDGKPYLIAPVVLIREGVLNGYLYLAEEFGRYAEAWNGRPVSLGHPQRNGEYVSANSVDIWANEVPGQLWNVVAETDKLKGEIWIDLEKAEKIGAPALEVVENLRAAAPMEVSTGLFADMEEATGTWNSKSYDGIARNIRPDHLALLPNEIGACSWEDGCGTPRVNQKGERMDEATSTNANTPVTNEMTLDDKATLVRRAFWDQVYTAEQDSPIYGDWDVVSVFDMTLIAKNWAKKTHMAFPYTMSDEGDVAFGEATAVEVVYRAKEGGAEVVVVNTETPAAQLTLWNRFRRWLAGGATEGVGEDEQPATNAGACSDAVGDARNHSQEANEVKKCDMVAALVANKQCKFSKEALEAMDEGTLATLQESLTANAASAAPAANADATTVTFDADAVAAKVLEAVNAKLDPVLASITANADRERAGLVAEIVANSDMAEDDLKPLSVEALKKLAGNVAPRDYSGAAGTFRNSEGGDEEYELAMPAAWAVAGEGK